MPPTVNRLPLIFVELRGLPPFTTTDPTPISLNHFEAFKMLTLTANKAQHQLEHEEDDTIDANAAEAEAVFAAELQDEAEEATAQKDAYYLQTKSHAESSNRISHVIASAVPAVCKTGHCLLGVDEAGRGPVLGKRERERTEQRIDRTHRERQHIVSVLSVQ